jgi:hypothetical protein
MKRSLASLLLGVTVSFPGPARAEPGASFQSHLDAGIRLYQKQMYADAAVELEAAYKIQPSPDVAFALAQALRQSGECARALTYYRQLLVRDLSPARRSAIEEAMVPCLTPELEPDGAAAKPAPGPAASTTEAVATDAEDDEAEASVDVDAGSHDQSASRWYADPLGTGLVVAGSAGVVLGVAGLVIMQSKFDAANNGTEKTFEADREAGVKWRLIGISSLVIGSALAAGGVYRWMKVAGEDDDEGGLALIPDPSGGILVTGKF